MAIVKRGAEGKSPVEYVRILDGIAKKENQIDAVIVVNIAEGTTLYSNDFRHKTGNIEYDQLSAAITGITSPLSQLFESGVASKLNHIDFSLDNVFLRVMPLSEENVVAVFVNANPSSFRLGPFDLNTKKEIVVVNEGYPT